MTSVEGIENKQSTMKKGWVYIVENPAWPNVVKIGAALHLKKRLGSYQTSDPYRAFRYVKTWKTDNREEHEAALHRQLVDLLLNGEWFRDDMARIEGVIEGIILV